MSADSDWSMKRDANGVPVWSRAAVSVSEQQDAALKAAIHIDSILSQAITALSALGFTATADSVQDARRRIGVRASEQYYSLEEQR